MTTTCQYCQYRGKFDLKSSGKRLCLHWDSWRYKRPVLPGMTCSKFKKDHVPERNDAKVV